MSLSTLNRLNQESDFPIAGIAYAVGVGITGLSVAGGGITYAAGYGFTPGFIATGAGVATFVGYQIAGAAPHWFEVIREREEERSRLGRAIEWVRRPIVAVVQRAQRSVQEVMSFLHPRVVERAEEARECFCGEEFKEGAEMMVHNGPGEEKHGFHRACIEQWIETCA